MGVRVTLTWWLRGGCVWGGVLAADPLFGFLKTKQGGLLVSDIKWNFTKCASCTSSKCPPPLTI